MSEKSAFREKKRYWRVSLWDSDGREVRMLVPVLTPNQVRRVTAKKRDKGPEPSEVVRGILITFVLGIGTYLAEIWREVKIR